MSPKFFPDLTMPSEPVRPQTPWTLDHLRAGFLTTAALLVVGVIIASVVGGWSAVYGVVLGLVIVAAFFAVGSWAVVALARHDDRLAFPAALGSYLLKIVLLGGLMMLLPIDGPIDVKAMAIAVVVGALAWSGAQIWHVLGKRIYYVDYHAPAADTDERSIR